MSNDPGTDEQSDPTSVPVQAPIEFSAASYANAEDTGGNLPLLILTGTIDTPQTIDVQVTGGTADGSDFTNTVQVTIPAGTYDGTAATGVPINLSITSDGVVEPDETITFGLANPDAGLIVDDADGDSSTQSTATYTINNDDSAPVASNDSTSTGADVTLTNFSVAGNDNDADGDLDASSVQLIDPDTNNPTSGPVTITGEGTYSVNADGTVNFDPDPGFEGNSSIQYQIEDDAGNVSNRATLTVAVAGASPVATNDSASVANDTNAMLNLSDNVSDPNNDVDLSTIDLDPATAGIQTSITVDGEGTWTSDAMGNVTFDPDPAFEGTASIPYVVSDDDGNVSNQANLSVTVEGADPVATDDSGSADTNTAVELNLSDNVSDPNNDVDLGTIDLDPSTSGIQTSFSITGEGTWTSDGAGNVTFTPDAAFEGTSSISYTVSDDDGNVSNVANLSATIDGADPVATDDSATVANDTDAILGLSDNVSDPNNDVDLSTIDLDPATAGIQTSITVDGEGTWTSDGMGNVTFDPDPAFEGTASIPYLVSDDDGNVSNQANLSVTVEGADPMAQPDNANADPDETITVSVLDNDSDANDDIDPTSVQLIDPDTGLPTAGPVTIPGEGTYTVNPDGSISFDPEPAFEGDSTISYVVSDDDGNTSEPAPLTITVAGAVPMADPDAASGETDETLTIAVLDNDTDANSDIDPTTVQLIDPVSGNPTAGPVTIPGEGTYSINPDGSVGFDPEPAFEGDSSIEYVVSDDDGNTSEPALISVAVGGATPVAVGESQSVDADTDAIFDLTDNASDPNDDLDFASVDLDPATPGIQTMLTTPDGTWTSDEAGNVTFDPASDFQGTTSIDFTVSDDDGNVSNIATLEVTVAGAPPEAGDDTAVTSPGSQITIDVLDNDSDANGDPLTVTEVIQPANGTVTINPDGTLTYVPDQGFSGIDEFVYTISDGNGNEVSASVTVNVQQAAPAAPLTVPSSSALGLLLLSLLLVLLGGRRQLRTQR